MHGHRKRLDFLPLGWHLQTFRLGLTDGATTVSRSDLWPIGNAMFVKAINKICVGPDLNNKCQISQETADSPPLASYVMSRNTKKTKRRRHVSKWKEVLHAARMHMYCMQRNMNSFHKLLRILDVRPLFYTTNCTSINPHGILKPLIWNQSTTRCSPASLSSWKKKKKTPTSPRDGNKRLGYWGTKLPLFLINCLSRTITNYAYLNTIRQDVGFVCVLLF